MSEYTLKYEPSWYHIGDTDDAWIALAYGVLVLGTIYLIEYICASILLSGADGMSLSEAAANITFRNSNWIQIAGWMRSLFLQRKRKCKRAIVALFVRFFVLAIDIAILYLAVPRGIEVFWSDVDSTQMSFRALPELPPNGPDVKYGHGIPRPCRPDPFEYSGFKPFSRREICLSIDRMSANNETATSELRNLSKTKDVYLINVYNESVTLTDLRLEVNYAFTHQFVETAGPFYPIKPPVGSLNGAMDAIVQSTQMFGRCERQILRNATAGWSEGVVICSGEKRSSFGFLFISPLHLLHNVISTKRSKNQQLVDYTGTIMRYKKGKVDISFKQCIFALQEEDNPLFSNSIDIREWHLGKVTKSWVDNQQN